MSLGFAMMGLAAGPAFGEAEGNTSGTRNELQGGGTGSEKPAGASGRSERIARNEGADDSPSPSDNAASGDARARLLNELSRIRRQTGDGDNPLPLDPPLPVRRKTDDRNATDNPADTADTVKKPVSAALERLTGQLVLTAFSGTSPNDTEVKTVHALLQRGALAGVVLSAENLVSKAQVKELIKFLALAGQASPVLIAIREPGGTATAFTLEKGFEPWPSEADVGSKPDPQYAYSTYRTLASNLAAVGFNLNFGPWLGLGTGSSRSPDSFSTEPRQAAVFAKTFVLGHRESGVIAVPTLDAGDGPWRVLDFLLVSHPDLSIAVVPGNGSDAIVLHEKITVRGARFCFLSKKDLGEAASRLKGGCDVLVTPGSGEAGAGRDRVLRSLSDAVGTGVLSLQQLSAAAARVNVIRAGIGHNGAIAISGDTAIEPITGKVDIDD